MEQIRENMFFVVTGVIVILCLVFHFNPWFSVQSWEDKNTELLEKVQGLEGELGNWVTQDFVPNTSALTAAQEFHDKYVIMFDGAEDKDGNKTFVGVKDMFARMVFKTELPGLEASQQESAQIFITEYRRLIRQLKAEAEASDIKATSGAWSFWDWGEGLPDARIQRQAATREYWLTSEILDVIEQKPLNVFCLDRLEIDPGVDKNGDFDPTARAWQRKGDYFDAIPFDLNVKMEFQKVPLLVAKLLTTKTPVYINRMSIGRVTDEERASVNLGPEASRVVLVNVKLHCLALSYREVVQKTMVPGLTSPGASSRSAFGVGGRRSRPR